MVYKVWVSSQMVATVNTIVFLQNNHFIKFTQQENVQYMTLLTKKDVIVGITLSLTQVSTFSFWFDETNSPKQKIARQMFA